MAQVSPYGSLLIYPRSTKTNNTRALPLAFGGPRWMTNLYYPPTSPFISIGTASTNLMPGALHSLPSQPVELNTAASSLLTDTQKLTRRMHPKNYSRKTRNGTAHVQAGILTVPTPRRDRTCMVMIHAQVRRTLLLFRLCLLATIRASFSVLRGGPTR